MKIICEGIELSDAVMKVSKACSTKTTNPILECIKITAENDAMTLIATDGEIAIQRKIHKLCPLCHIALHFGRNKGVENLAAAGNGNKDFEHL